LKDFELAFLEVRGFLISLTLLNGLGRRQPALAYLWLSWETIFLSWRFYDFIP